MAAFDKINEFQDDFRKQVEKMVDDAISTILGASHFGYPIEREISIKKLTILDTILVNASTRVRIYMNTLSPVHQLPPEILSHIFALVPGPSEYFKYRDHSLLQLWGPSAIGPASDILPLMKVCHRWNEILVQNATFWTEVNDNSRSGGNLAHYTNYLHRNLDGPLSVSTSPFPTAPTVDLLRDSSSRIEELFVSGDSGGRDVGNHLTHSAPLSLSATALTKCMLERVYSRAASSLLLFQGHAPRLAYLWLFGLSWIPSNSFPSLTHLFVDYRSIPHIPRLNYSFGDLLALLDGSPHLQVLYLRDVGNAKVKGVPNPGEVARKVPLMRLRKLSVVETKSDSLADHFQVALCSHINRPTNSLVYLSIHSTAGLGHLVETLSEPRLSHMRIRIPTPKSAGTKPSMWLQLVDDLGSMGIWHNLDLSLQALKPGKLSKGIVGSADRREAFYAAVSGYSRFQNVKTLNLTWYALNYLLQNPSIFDALASLDTLTFSKIRPSVSPGRALSMLLPPSNTSQSRTSIVFPQLKTLGIMVSPPVEFEDLHDILRSRRQASYPIQQLVIAFLSSPEVPTAEQLHTLTQIRGEVKNVDVHGAYKKRNGWPNGFGWTSKLPTECVQQYHGSDTAPLWPAWND